jgi:hypothetical protein
MMRLRTAILVLFLVLLMPFLYGHDLFIKLDTYFVDPHTEVRIPILNGTFELSENSVAADRVAELLLAPGAKPQRLSMESWDASGDTTFMTLQTGESGTYVLGVSTNPRLIELDAASFNEYLDHDGIPDVLEARGREGELERDVVERYSKHVKAVFQVGESRGGGWGRGLGFAAEIVPLSNPYELRVGDDLLVSCLVFGEPIANQLIIAGGVNPEGTIAERASRTDDAGIARFTIDSPGQWYVKFIHMEKTAEEGVDYESTWATLSFQL